LKNNRVEKVTVDMGKADFSPQNVPVNTISSWILHPITVFETEYKITALSVGNPHAVCFTTKVDELNLPKIGGFIGSLESFPEGVNVEFAEIISQTHLRMRVWERGSGETFACGTGACAVVSAAIKNGFCSCGNDICVSLLGGDLNINVRADGEIFMTGTATKVYDGEI
ncbi:MAG: diaminopimelate epimerase, partial [Clostridia bacterium]